MDIASTIARLRSDAAELRARAAAAGKRGDAQAMAAALLEASTMEEAAGIMEAAPAGRLREREQSRSVNRAMEAVHKVAISEGRSRDPLAAAARRAGMSVNDLAKAVGKSKALISMARNGERSIKRAVAEQIEALTTTKDKTGKTVPGFAATAANWPGGLVD